MGHNNYYGPGAPCLTAKAEKHGDPKQVSQTTTQEPTVSKMKKKKHIKMKAPTGDDETDESGGDQGTSSMDWTEEDLEEAYHRSKLKAFLRKDPVMKTLKVKMHDQLHGPVTALRVTSTDLDVLKALMNLLHEAGMVAGNSRAETLFDFGFEALKKTLVTLHGYLKALVGEIPPKEVPRHVARASGPSSSAGSLDGSSSRSQYESATSSMVSALMDTVNRMQLGPSGAALLEARIREAGHLDVAHPRVQPQEHEDVTGTRCKVEPRSQGINMDQDVRSGVVSSSALQSYFEKSMVKFFELHGSTHNAPHWNALDRRKTMRDRVPTDPRPSQRAERLDSPRDTPDVDMESAGSSHEEYDPDDLTFPLTPARATVATAMADGPPTVIPHIRVSASSDLKEFNGKDNDEDRARSWSAQVKTAFIRDQAPDSEKCFIFGGLLTGPAKNWYRQLSRTVRGNWKQLLQEFQTQFCGLGVSVARQYYHARKRSEESPLEYLYRLNVAGLRAKLDIKSGPPNVRREHVDYYVENLDDRELADQLTLLGISDADDLEEVLRTRQRAKTRQGRVLFGSNKFRQKAPAPPNRDHTKNLPRRPIQVIRATSESVSEQESSSSGSEGEGDLRRAYAVATKSYAGRARNADEPRDHQDPDPDRDRRMSEGPGPGSPVVKCTHCGSKKHGDLDCWKRLVCERCGKKGHPADRCFFVCRGCGEVHDVGKCKMELFYNVMRQWYNPTKHAGQLPEIAEKMLN